jgi:hypothetical protein
LHFIQPIRRRLVRYADGSLQADSWQGLHGILGLRNGGGKLERFPGSAMHQYYRDYGSRAKTIDVSLFPFFFSGRTALRGQSEPGDAMSGEAAEPLVVSGLTKTEAEELLDYFETAGLGPAQLSYVSGEGFRVRLPVGTKSTTGSKS